MTDPGTVDVNITLPSRGMGILPGKDLKTGEQTGWIRATLLLF